MTSCGTDGRVRVQKFMAEIPALKAQLAAAIARMKQEEVREWLLRWRLMSQTHAL